MKIAHGSAHCRFCPKSTSETKDVDLTHFCNKIFGFRQETAVPLQWEQCLLITTQYYFFSTCFTSQGGNAMCGIKRR